MILKAVLLGLFQFPAHAGDTVRIHGTCNATSGIATLYEFEPRTLEYESAASSRVSGTGGFDIRIPFTNVNLYKLKLPDGREVYLSVEDTSQIKVTRTDGKVNIQGSPSSGAILTFERQNQALQARYFGDLKRQMDQAMQAGDKEKIDQHEKEAALALTSFLTEFRALITELGETPAGYFAIQYSDFNKEIDFIETRLAAFREHLPESPVTMALENQVRQARALSVGSFPPPFKVRDMNGNWTGPELLKGKLVLIDFWASWCRACRIENPRFAALQKQYGPLGFTVLSISQDVPEEDWKTAIRKDGTGAFIHVFDAGNRISDLYNVSSLPQNLLLDESGRIIAKNLDAKTLEQFLDKQ